MKITKSTHLMRLLQTQDALLVTFGYMVTVQAAYWFDYFSRAALIENLWLTPVVALLAIVAVDTTKPKLHGQSILDHVLAALRLMAIVVGGLLIASFVGKLEYTSRAVVLLYAGFLGVMYVVNRLFLSWYYLEGREEHEANFLKVLVIGAGPRAQKLIGTYREHSEWGIEIVGTLDPDHGGAADVVNGNADGQVRNLGALEAIEDVLANEVVDEVIVCLPRSMIGDIERIVLACEEQAVCLKYMADMYDMQTKDVNLEQLGEVPILSFEPIAQDEGKLVIKRIIDLFVVIAAAPFLAVLFVIVAIAIKLDSPGPVFFRQQRVGLNKRQFAMIKFRSMFVDAEERMAEIEHLNEADGPIFKIKDDPRVTRVGRLIRRTSIDELPQLINVFMGQMSLVGPRPMSLRDVEQFSKGIQRKRFSVKPGLACLREVSGRSRLSFERWLELDLQYIDEWSIWLDLRILLLLVPSVIRGDGAS